MQSEKLAFGKLVGANRVRGCFSTKEKAEEYIGPIEEEYIKCKTCSRLRRNEAVDLDHNFENWRKKLFIQEWEVK
jgi:hypothetical protein